jgi:hypothetical protein
MKATDSKTELLQVQRDQAIACVVLSFIIAIALVLSTFSPEIQTKRAYAAVEEQKVVLANLQQVLERNTAELSQDLSAVGLLRRAGHR